MSKETPLFEIPLIVTHKNNNPYIMLRTGTGNLDIMKIIISSAFHQRPLIIQPVFRDRMRSISSLVDKGIIYYDKEKDNYFFNI